MSEFVGNFDDEAEHCTGISLSLPSRFCCSLLRVGVHVTSFDRVNRSQSYLREHRSVYRTDNIGQPLLQMERHTQRVECIPGRPFVTLDPFFKRCLKQTL